MTKSDDIKKDLTTMHDLEGLTDMLEQTAARTIAQMRESIVDSRQFFREVWRIYGIIKQLTPPPPEVVHKHLVVVVGIDWGMPGNLLNRVIDEAQRRQKADEADVLVAGKMAHSRFRGTDGRTVHFFTAPKNPTLADIAPIYKVVAQYAHATIVYPTFISLGEQKVETASFSIGDKDPNVVDSNPENESRENHDILVRRFIIDPDPQIIANYLNEAVVGLTIHHYFAEALLAYSAAQMVAMRNSRDNAKEASKRLLVRYNRARRELIDTKIRELYGSRIQRGNR